jgi:hypothetical protein
VGWRRRAAFYRAAIVHVGSNDIRRANSKLLKLDLKELIRTLKDSKIVRLFQALYHCWATGYWLYTSG